MTLAQRFNRFVDNRVLATEVPCTLLATGRFYEGDWLLLAGRELWRVWGFRNDADTVYLY